MSKTSPTPGFVPDSWARMIWILVETPDDPKFPAIGTSTSVPHLTSSLTETLRSRHQHQHSGYAPHPLHNLKESFVPMTTFPCGRMSRFSAEYVDVEDGLFQSSNIYITRGTSGSTLMGRGYVPIKTLVPS